MRMLVLIILSLVFSCQLSATRPVTKDARPLQVDSVTYYESQINLADSLYKNYLPQYNFEEVKAAVGFFDSLRLTTDNSQQTTDFFHRFRKNKSSQYLSNSQTLCNSDAYPRTVDCCPLTVDIEFLCARAHYYHAVGLTEREDIVGACEHYLRALEIMEFETENLRTSKSEKRSQSRKVARSQSDCLSDSATQIPCDPETLRPCDLNKEDYEKIRFLALIYTRLGELFHNEGCTSIAKDAYKKCINIFISLNDSIAFANYYKQLGDIYIIEDNYDSSLFFYNKSIESLDNANNPITRDSWKGISAVLHHNGDVDSSYKIIKELVSVADGDEQYAYKTKLAQMYYKDEVYDSALIYFEEVLKRDNKYTKISAANYISKIYAAKGDAENSNYFLNLYSDELIEEFNRTSHKSQIMKLYNDYMYKRPLSHETGKSNFPLILLMIMVLCLFSFMILLNYGRKKHVDNSHKTNEERIAVHLEEIEKLRTEINQAQNNLNDLRFKNSFTEGKIKKQNAELKKKEELIGKYTAEISNLKYRLERKRIDVSNLNNYLQSDICSRILNEINELSDKRLKSNMLSPLSKEEFVLLLNSANHHLNYFINDMAKKYPKLKKEDLYYLCFVIMGLDNNQIASLFGVTYDTAKKREKKICVIFDLDPKENLSNYLLHLV